MRVARAGLAVGVAGALVAVVMAAGGDRSAAATSGHAVALVDAGGRWHVRSPDGAVSSFYFGNPGDHPVMGRWDGGPVGTVGMYRPSDGFFYSRSSNSQGIADSACFAGDPGDLPLGGDWDGDGVETLGLYRSATQTFHLFDDPCADAPMGSADVSFTFGDPGDVPFAGDLDGDGITEVALHRPADGRVYYRDTLTPGAAHHSFTWGNPGDVVFAGDWDGDGVDSVGLFRAADSTFYLRNANSAGIAHESFTIPPGAGRPASGATGAAIAITPFPGPPGDRAVDHIPDTEFPDPPPADVVAPDGIPISTRDLFAVLEASASVAEVTDLLESLQAEVVAGDPAGHLVLLRLVGPTDLRRVLEAQAAALESDALVAATINMAAADDILPRHVVNTTNNRWTWEVPPNPASGSWALKRIRAPQAWNLVDHAVRQDAAIDAFILDSSASTAEDTHPDLHPNVVKLTAVAPASDHDTFVAGIIGARPDNAAGVAGVYPRPLTMFSGWESWGSFPTRMTRMLSEQRFVRIVTYSAGMNRHYGANNLDPLTAGIDHTMPVGPANPTWRTQMDNTGNTLLATLQAWEAERGGRTTYLVFCSAGNLRLRPGTGLDFHARDNSACANVAARGVGGAGLPGGGAGADHFFAVESMNSAGNRSPTSASAGTLSAPGDCVRSTQARDATAFDRFACGVGDGPAAAYATNSGTSFATPHAGGLAAYLWSLDPRLSYDQVSDILTDPANRVTVRAGPLGGMAGAERIDAFAAVMGIDVERGNRTMQLALVDVDDGSRFDGNARLDHDDEDGDGVTTEVYPHGIDRADNRRGDGVIDMRDFRAFRDALLQSLAIDGVLPAASVALDGPAAHFKKDLNVDGCVAAAAASPPNPTVPAPPTCANGTPENVYARYDFNGDGSVNGHQTAPPAGDVAPFKRDPDTNCTGLHVPVDCVRDVDVLAHAGLWTVDPVEDVRLGSGPEPSGCTENRWGPANFLLEDRDGDGVVDYLLSMDLHFVIGPLGPGYDKVTITVSSQQAAAPPPAPWARCVELPVAPFGAGLRHILTVPLFAPMQVDVTIVAEDNRGMLPDLNLVDQATYSYGQDALCVFDAFNPGCS